MWDDNRPVVKIMLGLPEKTEVLRVLLIGLPFCGLEEVAEVLQEDYSLSIFRADPHLKPPSKSYTKYVREVCFREFREAPRAVLLASEVTRDVLLELKKRNYLNIVLVDASFQQRLRNFLRHTSREENMESVKELMALDEPYHRQEFQDCLEYVRVRVLNRGGKEELRGELRKREKEVIRYFRPTWDQYFMKIADIARRRSNCMKTSVGAVIVNDENRVVSTGYNGTPKGIPSCYRMGCERCNNNQGKQLDQCLCLHAEESAIIEVGIGKTEGCRLYTTYYPCFSCAKIIKQAGIKKIYYMDEYEKEDSGKPFISIYFKPEDVVKIAADNLYY